jgi:glyoxylase I family protein
MALPGLRGAEHLGFTVPDLEEAHRFLVETIGCEHVYSLPEMRSDDSDWMREHLNVDPRAAVKEIRFYRCGTGPNFEVFEYSVAPEQRPQPRNSDVGGHHVAFYVDDLDAAVARLHEEGIRVLGEPTASANASRGQRWVYFLSPWGMQFELVSYPEGKAYEQDSPVLLWHPARPAE